MNFPILRRLKLRLRRRGLPVRLSSLVMIFQRAPLLKLLPEARIISTSGFGEALKWTITAIAGLGAYDSVAGASIVTQVAPAPNMPELSAVAGQPLTFVFQYGGADTPHHFQITTHIPPGLTHTGTTGSKTDSISGIPTADGIFPITVIAWRDLGQTMESVSETFTLTVSLPPSPQINAQPAGGNFAEGALVSLVAGQSNGATFTWKLNDQELPAGESVLFSRGAPRQARRCNSTNTTNWAPSGNRPTRPCAG